MLYNTDELKLETDESTEDLKQGFYSEEFKQKLAIGFPNCIILSNEMILLKLKEGKVEEWKVELTVLEEKDGWFEFF